MEEKKKRVNSLNCIILFFVFFIIGCILAIPAHSLYIVFFYESPANNKCNNAFDCKCEVTDEFCECTYCKDELELETEQCTGKVKCDNFDYYKRYEKLREKGLYN